MDKTIKLKDGRNLSYMEYGDPDGSPVLLFHGTPGSKYWFLDDDETANSLKLRLIALERPGYGLIVQVDEAASEPHLLSKDWGFQLSEIRCSVHIWHGEEDRMALFEEARKMSLTIPKCYFHSVPHAGHFLTNDEQTWSAILSAIKQDYDSISGELDFKTYG